MILQTSVRSTKSRVTVDLLQLQIPQSTERSPARGGNLDRNRVQLIKVDVNVLSGVVPADRGHLGATTRDGHHVRQTFPVGVGLSQRKRTKVDPQLANRTATGRDRERTTSSVVKSSGVAPVREVRTVQIR